MVIKRLKSTQDFVRAFIQNVLFVREVLVSLLVLITLGGVAISQIEGIRLGEAIYFAFITGFSIGYNDFTPETAWGRAISVLIGLTGLIFVGITAAAAICALTDVTRQPPRRDSKDA